MNTLRRCFNTRLSARASACLIAAGLLAAGAAHAAPMGFAGSAMTMFDYDESWRMVSANYALTRSDAIGASVSELRPERGQAHESLTQLEYVRLLRRWNLSDAQANVWLFGGLARSTPYSVSSSTRHRTPRDRDMRGTCSIRCLHIGRRGRRLRPTKVDTRHAECHGQSVRLEYVATYHEPVATHANIRDDSPTEVHPTLLQILLRIHDSSGCRPKNRFKYGFTFKGNIPCAEHHGSCIVGSRGFPHACQRGSRRTHPAGRDLRLTCFGVGPACTKGEGAIGTDPRCRGHIMPSNWLQKGSRHGPIACDSPSDPAPHIVDRIHLADDHRAVGRATLAIA